jgi:hypothetical protein
MFAGAAVGGVILGLGDAYNLMLALHAAVVFRGADLAQAVRQRLRGLIARALLLLLLHALPSLLPGEAVARVFASAAITYTISFGLAAAAVLVLYRSVRAPWARVWLPRITQQAANVYLEEYRAWQERSAAERAPDA